MPMLAHCLLAFASGFLVTFATIRVVRWLGRMRGGGLLMLRRLRSILLFLPYLLAYLILWFAACHDGCDGGDL